MLECAQSKEKVGIVAPKFVSPDGRLSEAGGVIWSDGTAAKFNSPHAMNRPALLLTNGIIYVAFGSNGCNDSS